MNYPIGSCWLYGVKNSRLYLQPLIVTEPPYIITIVDKPPEVPITISDDYVWGIPDKIEDRNAYFGGAYIYHTSLLTPNPT